MIARPKVLVISPFIPYPLNSGSRIRTFESLQRISTFADITLAVIYYSYQDLPALFELNHQFDNLLAARLARGEPGYEHLPVSISDFSSHHMEGAIIDTLTRARPDLIHLNFAYAGSYTHLFHGIPVLLEEHNVEYDVVKRSGSHEDYEDLRNFEQDLWRSVDHCIAVTQRDFEMMAETIPAQKISLLPNGVDTRYFQPSPNPGELKLIFIGTLDYPPNQQAIRNIWEFIWPNLRQQQIPWYIIGSGMPGDLDFVHSDPQIHFLHNIPDIRPYLDSNSIMVVPLQVGGGSRIKILTALAMGSPIVSTAIGCEGIDVTNEEHILIADDPQTMLTQINRLCKDPLLRISLSRSGRQLVEKHYDWGIVLEPLHSIYNNLLA